MGLGALAENGISAKLYYFFRDRRLVPASEPLRRVRPSRLALFVGVQLLGFAATFAITQTIGMCIPLPEIDEAANDIGHSGDRVPARHLPARACADVRDSTPALHARGARDS
jgi:hypothetical protein